MTADEGGRNKEETQVQGPDSAGRRQRREELTISPSTLKAFQELAKIDTGALKAIQDFAKIKTGTLKAFQDFAKIDTGTAKALQDFAKINTATVKAFQELAKIDAGALKAIQDFANINTGTIKAFQRLAAPSLPSSRFARDLRSAREANWLRFAGMAAEDEGASERQQRAWRNAAVHAETGGAGPADSSADVIREPPPPKTAREQKVRRMAPPGMWPGSWQARRVRKAALAKRAVDVIVLAADIRHSTDLMNEAIDQYVFAATLEAFLASSRDCVGRNKGWHASFTGDGFLVFWPVTEKTRNAAVRAALRTISQLFAEFEAIHIPQFASNTRQFREDTGLSIGLDRGEVAVVEVGEEATIVGRPVVGATRLVAAGFEWEVLASNHLGNYLHHEANAGSLKGVNIKKTVVPTKDFELLRAYSVEYEWTQRPLHSRPS